MRKSRLSAVVLAVSLMTAGCGGRTAAPVPEATSEPVSGSPAGAVASGEETISPMDVVEEDMVPVYGESIKNGTYSIQVDSSSSMFQITDCQLTVQDGRMSAVMTMGGTGYGKLFMGTGEEAAKASEEDCIPYVEKEDGSHSFEVPVEALDQGICCAAFSRNKEKWYDRVLVFRADSLSADAFADGTIATAESLGLKDGTYTAEVELEGGSGRAKVESPAVLRVENGMVFATIIWGSANYDYMKVDGTKYERLNVEGNSAFEIPVSGFDWGMPVIADTIAMSEPHEISYTLRFDSATLKRAIEPERSMELSYASQFSVDYYEGGFALITVKDSGRFLVVPEGAEVPSGLPETVAVLRQPLQNIYLAATSAMDLVCRLDGLDAVTLSGTKASGWYVQKARQAMEDGTIEYAGKYSAPDYELILSKGCDLAIESTMIYHTPEVKEQLEQLGIPVFVERSSYENHPLGRMEWLKLYGVLLDKEALAGQYFAEQLERLEPVLAQEPTGKTAAFFYITSNGAVNVRKPGDYVSKMIELAGGTYVPQLEEEQESALSTVNMQMEAFYAAAKDADYLIYNSTIDGELQTVQQLLEKNSLLADFKAVKTGQVWCTEKNLFQETMGLGDMILDIRRMLTGETDDPAKFRYLHRLEGV